MREDKIIGIMLVIFSGLMFYKTLEFPPAMFGSLGAGVFPQILFTLLGLAWAGLTISGFLRDRKSDKEEGGGEEKRGQFNSGIHARSPCTIPRYHQLLPFFLLRHLDVLFWIHDFNPDLHANPHVDFGASHPEGNNRDHRCLFGYDIYHVFCVS